MNKLQKDGYSRYDLMKSLNYEGIEQDYNEILAYFADLPEDDYSPNLNRYRRYSRAIVLPGTEDVFWLPTIERNGVDYSAYFQGKFNPEHSGSYREFHSIDENIRSNKLLNDIIIANYHETFWNEEDKILPIHVGVHFVKLYVENDGDKAVSSPNCLHQDGEPFTFAHLIERKNIVGGTNAIAVPEAAGNNPEDTDENNIIEVFEMENPLESYGVYDPNVSHYVSPVEKGSEQGTGLRSVILIDYQQTVVADVDE
ncbi:2OG-Fe dioxygenase family protein [Staphylococcus sp. GDY8P197P]|uniref:2OG-Fe dioxygenase family protein n=1 Tax=Staphylococcus sp. GDY8P197P TaxID=2804173 RepID=UPI001AEC2697|nr:2OG-Fe dioxygenase family protein [Staphylococcus sp. GDY8P197P]